MDNVYSAQYMTVRYRYVDALCLWNEEFVGIEDIRILCYRCRTTLVHGLILVKSSWGAFKVRLPALKSGMVLSPSQSLRFFSMYVLVK